MSHAYRPARPPRQEQTTLRGLSHRLQRWGPPDGPLVVLLHGWMDCGATFQFLADRLPGHWSLLAPDWRGFGGSAPAPHGYWFPDYLADLDALVSRHAGSGRPVSLVGHSMGGNVACLYAGVRPERVRRLVSLEGFGLPATAPGEAPERYREWLDALERPPASRQFPDLESLAGHLRARSAGLGAAEARFIAGCWARPDPEGGWHLHGDPAHRRPNPVLYRLDEAMACWRRVTAPVLWVSGTESRYADTLRRGSDWAARTACFADFREIRVEGAGHGLHQERPERVAELLEGFLA